TTRYKSRGIPQCFACVRRRGGDTCRFQHVRVFLYKDEAPTAEPFITYIHADDIYGDFIQSRQPQLDFPHAWNEAMTDAHVARVKTTIAKALMPVLKQELVHLQDKAVWRALEHDVRATCDTCLTSIFSGTWMCRQCGREVCADCFDRVRQLAPVAAGPLSDGQKNLLTCMRSGLHDADKFQRTSRFTRHQLQAVVAEMESLHRRTPTPTPTPADNLNLLASVAALSPPIAVNAPLPPTSSPPRPPLQIRASSPIPTAFFVPPHHSPPPGCTIDRVGLPVYPTQTFLGSELTEMAFQRIWARGQPVVVTGQLDKFQLRWTPEYFIDKYGAEPCQLVECQSEHSRSAHVADFFRMFGRPRDASVWKLKDWPPAADFAVAFPELYEDFVRAVPVPAYARRDGVLNIASHFPDNTVKPDLGPKMYNALATDERSGSMGSTRLHMDMADAVNIMLYAAHAPGADRTHPPCAVWDLYRADDADKVRAFLRERFDTAPDEDPIHAQKFYLDVQLRRELWEEKHVMSYRVYQAPGDVVFIPAGCAHQVCNLADCIKVAADFVSPENVARCAQLTEEFRQLNLAHVWKEDVLQLRAMMWYAWMSCARPGMRAVS
ncbi:hypothetical protein K488DRAFT_16888, partial [Vararia minispora EC-137]